MRKQLILGGLFNSLAETQTPDGRAYRMSNASVDDKTFKCGKRYAKIGQRASPNANDVCFGLGYGKFTPNATTSLIATGVPTGGSVILRSPLQGATNSLAIPYNAYPSDFQEAISVWTAFDDGELTFSGGPWPSMPIYATYKGRYGGQTQALLTLQTNNLTGGAAPSVTIASYITGGAAEGYLAVIQPSGSGTCTLYWVTSADSFVTTTWTSVATGLTASDWFFEQYADKVYAANSTDGLTWYQIGGAWQGKAGITSIQNPIKRPTASPWFDQGAGNAFAPFLWNVGGGDATFGTFTGWGTNPTITIGSSKQNLNILLNAPLTNKQVSFIATLNAAQDLSREDLQRLQITVQNTLTRFTPSGFNLQITNADAAPLTFSPAFSSAGGAPAPQLSGGRDFHFGSLNRSTRDNILKLKITMTFENGVSGQQFQLMLFPLDTWPNDMMVSLDMDAGPVNRGIEYAYSWLKASNQQESKLSPAKLSPAMPGDYPGCHVVVNCPGNPALTTADYVNLYRKDRYGLWRLVGTGFNSTTVGGGTDVYDKNMLDELDTLPIYGVIHLPGGFLPDFIARWKQGIAVASGRLLFLSYTGQPTLYDPDPDDFASRAVIDTTDPDRPRTLFMADNRGENVIGIVGQDSLYMAGPDTGYAMTGGDKPQQLSPPRGLPGARGCMGHRAGCKLSGGSLFAYRDGLWYYAVSAGFQGLIQPGTIVEEEISKEIRGTWNTVFGASPSAAILTVFDEEIWAFSGASYIKFSRNKQIESGTFADSVKAVMPTQANGLVFVTMKGELMQVGSQVTDDGDAVSFTYATGILEGQRSRITNLEVHYSCGSGTRPAILLECWDGLGGYEYQRFDMEPTNAEGAPTVSYDPAGILIQGYRFRITLYGSGSDVISSVAVDFKEAGGGRGN